MIETYRGDRGGATKLAGPPARPGWPSTRLRLAGWLGLALALASVSGHGAQVADSYSRAAVSGADNVGGLVGSVAGGSVVRAYSTGRVTGAGGNAGGLVGSRPAGTVGKSYWDRETSAQPTSAGGAGRATVRMVHPHASDTYVEWDFQSVWSPDSGAVPRNGGYPYLRGVTPEAFAVTLSAQPPEGGTVSGGGAYAAGASATATATASEGWGFVSWTEGAVEVSIAAVYAFPVTASRSLTAHFEEEAVVTYGLTVTLAGTGSGTVTSSPAGIQCGSACSAEIEAGVLVELTAAPAAGSRFAGWSGACTGTATCQVSMSQARAVTATFRPVAGGELTNGVPLTNLSGAKGSKKRFFIQVPSGAVNLKFTLSVGTGDADLYVRFGEAPTLYEYDCFSWNIYSDEECPFPGAGTGIYHVMVEGYQAYSGATLQATFLPMDAVLPGRGGWRSLLGRGAVPWPSP
jgi:hypothetical protein